MCRVNFCNVSQFAFVCRGLECCEVVLHSAANHYLPFFICLSRVSCFVCRIMSEFVYMTRNFLNGEKLSLSMCACARARVCLHAISC